MSIENKLETVADATLVDCIKAFQTAKAEMDQAQWEYDAARATAEKAERKNNAYCLEFCEKQSTLNHHLDKHEFGVVFEGVSYLPSGLDDREAFEVSALTRH
jgi:hypothetical protein